MKKSKKLTPTPNHFKRWTSKEDAELKEAIDAGYDVRETAALLGRTTASIHTRKFQLFSPVGDTRRFPITERKDTVHRLMKLSEFDEEQQLLIRRELLISSREDLCKKWLIDQRTIRQYPDEGSGDALRAYHATLLFETKQEAADHLGWGIRTLYRRLQEYTGNMPPTPPNGFPGGIPPELPIESPEPPPIEALIEAALPELTAVALLVRDVVIALKPYGISCSFEFEGDQVMKMTATFN
jgi:hypothetical protein